MLANDAVTVSFPDRWPPEGPLPRSIDVGPLNETELETHLFDDPDLTFFGAFAVHDSGPIRIQRDGWNTAGCSYLVPLDRQRDRFVHAADGTQSQGAAEELHLYVGILQICGDLLIQRAKEDSATFDRIHNSIREDSTILTGVGERLQKAEYKPI